MQQLKQYDRQVEALLASMSVSEKIGQLNQVVFNGLNFQEVAAQIKARKVGSLILATSSQTGNDDQRLMDSDVTNQLQKLAMEHGGIPLILGRDVIHGHKVVYPIPLAMAATFDPDRIRTCYREIAEEAANDGIHWSFAPMLDISRDPRWGRCIESPGEDPYLGCRIAEAVVEGFQGDDYTKRDCIAACAKHYVGYGASEGGRDYNATEIGEPTLRNFYLPPFQAAVKAGAATVMSAFNALSGEPVSSSEFLLRDVLKEQFGFDGFVVSDWGAVEMHQRFGVAQDRKACAELCLNAGVDMDMVDQCYADHVQELVEEGKISMEILDDSVRRILRVKYAFGLFEHPYAEKKPVDLDRHMQSARKTAEEAVVLLKNRDQVLPLRKDQKVSAVGPMLRLKRDLLGSWTLDYDLNRVMSFQEAFVQDYPDADVRFSETELQDSMLLNGRNTDVFVAFLGESALVTGEARSVSSVDIPQDQVALVRKLYESGKRVVAVLCFGRVTGLQEIEPYCDAIVYAWHGGSAIASAVLRTLYGDNVPSGSLPMTILRRTGQIPLYYNQPRSGRDADTYYGCQNNCYEDVANKPLYPFGFGLSYTTFQYGQVQITHIPSFRGVLDGKKVHIQVSVSNTGNRGGYETVQCYIKDLVAQIARPQRELKGFRKVYLEPGETKGVTFALGLEELGYWNRRSQFGIDPGDFEVYVGRGAFAEQMGRFTLSAREGES